MNSKIGSYISCNEAYYEVESVGPKAVSQLLSHGCQSNGRVSVLVLKYLRLLSDVSLVHLVKLQAVEADGPPLWSEWQSSFLGFNILLLFSEKFGGKPP